MSDPFEHLAPEAHAALAQGKEARLAFIKLRHWFDYPRATQILERLDELVTHPDVSRMPCLMVVGSSNNGKTSIAKVFVAKYPSVTDAEKAIVKMPVLFIASLTDPSPFSLFTEIISLMGLPYSSTKDVLKLKIRVYALLKELGVRVLVVDELNTILPLTNAKRAAFLAELRSLSVKAGISVVCFTTTAGARTASHDEAFTNRFPIMDLPVWELSDIWREMVRDHEGYLPFPQPSNLSSSSFSQTLLIKADYRLGEMADLLEAMSSYAIKNNLPKLTTEVIKDCGWIPPQDRLGRVNALKA